MAKIWLTIAALVIVLTGLLLATLYLRSGPEPQPSAPVMTEQQHAEAERQRQERLRQKELARQRLMEQRRQAEAALEQTRRQQPTVEQIEPDEFGIEELEAAQLYQRAELQYNVGRRVGGSFKNTIEDCREIIRKYPNTSSAQKAQLLLRKIPERFRRMYNVTDEEMGL